MHSVVLGVASTELRPSRVIDLSNQELEPAEAIIIAGWLSGPAAAGVTRLDLTGNLKLGTEGAKAIADVLPKTAVHSVVLGVASTELRPSRVTLGVIDLSSQELGPAEAIIVAGWLSSPAAAGVTRLDLTGNFIVGRKSWMDTGKGAKANVGRRDSSEGLAALCDALSASFVTELVVANCYIFPDGIRLLAAMLSNSQLRVLDISGNLPAGEPIRDDKTTHWLPGRNTASWSLLCDALCQSTTIRAFRAPKCFLGPMPVAMLSASLARFHGSVQHLDISNNPVTSGTTNVYKTQQDHVSQRGTTTTAYFMEVHEGTDNRGVKQLSQCLDRTKLHRLIVSGCGINEDGRKTIEFNTSAASFRIITF